MFETNTQNNSVLISLARAAQITGYHQDYLGQLCRLGKLPATKKGRVWFTSEEALNKLSSASEVNEVPAPNLTEEIADAEQFDFTEPEIVHNITVSQVEGMPISIRTMATPARGANNVQNILTTLRIEALQQEIHNLRQMLTRLMVEVANHTTILQNKSQSQQSDLLRHSYISNFDFNAPQSRVNAMEQGQSKISATQLESPEGSRRKSGVGRTLIIWLPTAAALAAIIVVGFTVISGQFLGSAESQVSTIYYHTNQLAESAETPLEPMVAGDTLPTVPAGDLR